MTLPLITALPTAPSRSDPSATFVARADAMVAALPGLVSDINAWSAQVPGEVDTMNFGATSTTSVLIGTGTKTFTAQAAKNYYVGQWLLAASSATPANYMFGQCTAYNSTTGSLSINSAYVGGSGTFASWNIGPAPVPNTQINPRAITAGTTLGTMTPDADNADYYVMSGLTGAVTIAAPSGTLSQGQRLILRLKDNGVTRAITWNAIYKPFGTALPTTTTINKSHVLQMIYNSVDSTWMVVLAVIET